MKKLFVGMPEIVARSFWGWNFLWQLTAVFLTYVIVVSGFDWKYFVFIRNQSWAPWLFPAVILGVFVPILVPLGILAWGHSKRSKLDIARAWALGQAALIGVIVSSFYKALTGRIPPNVRDLATNISNGFQFGFWRDGIFWGWPSGHTTVAFAFGVTLVYAYPKSRAVALAALLYAFYIGFGVSGSIHWFSEFAAGALIGAAIGLAAGERFRKAWFRNA